MKKRNVNSLTLKKTTISNFLLGGMVDSDNACPSAVSCESVCFCIPAGLTDNCFIAAPLVSSQCELPVGSHESPASPASPAG